MYAILVYFIYISNIIAIVGVQYQYQWVFVFRVA